MEQDGHAPCAKFVEEAIKSVRMVGMAMAQDNGLNATEVDAQHCEVVQCTFRCHSGIKKDRLTLSLVDNGDQQGNTMLGTQLISYEAILRQRETMCHLS